MTPAATDNTRMVLLSARAGIIYLFSAALSAAGVLLTLPEGDIFRRSFLGGRPVTFAAAATITLIMSVVASLLFAQLKVGGDSPLRLENWIIYSSLPARRLWAGELGFALGHTVVITALLMPACIVAAAITGVPARVLPYLALLLFLTGGAVRLLGLLVGVLPSASAVHTFFLLWLPAVLYLLVVPALWPSFHPLGALSAVLPGEELFLPAMGSSSTLPFWAGAVVFGTSCAGLSFAVIVLRRNRRGSND